MTARSPCSTDAALLSLARRRCLRVLGAAGLAGSAFSPAQALSLSDADATSGLRAALAQGAQAAVSLLGQADGFLGNPAVRIPLPGPVEQVAKVLRRLGQGKRLDALETALNRAAEQAVPQATPILGDAVKAMTVDDAQKILRGGDTSVTDYFAGKTRAPLGEKFLPIVTTATERVALVDKYNAVASRASGMGLVSAGEANLQQYVTGKTLDGLFFMIGEEERKIRQNPAGAGSAILQKVFGALR